MKKYNAWASLLLSLALLPMAACTATEREEPLRPEEPYVAEELSEELPPESEPEEEPPLPEPENMQARYLRVNADVLNVRTGAGKGYAVLGGAEKNTLLADMGKADGWYETRYMGRKAYVSAAYVTPLSLDGGDSKTERVIEEGVSLLGTPYVYGATRLHDGRGNLLRGFTDTRFDCSSLMQYIFYRGANALLNVTTRTQVLQGEEVAFDALQRGDLLFFTNASRKNNRGLERIGHVALYLGEGYILHTASDFAKIERLSAARRAYFITARRILTA